MNRRAVLSALPLALTATLAGCFDDDGSAGDDDDDDAADAPTRDAGESLVDVTVDDEFDGDVVLEVGCRTETYALESDDSVDVVREEDGEACSIRLRIDGATAYTATVAADAVLHLSVTSKGAVRASSDVA